MSAWPREFPLGLALAFISPSAPAKAKKSASDLTNDVSVLLVRQSCEVLTGPRLDFPSCVVDGCRGGR